MSNRTPRDLFFAFLLSTVATVGCGDSSGISNSSVDARVDTPDARGTDATTPPDAAVVDASPTDGAANDAALTDAGPDSQADGATPQPLTRAQTWVRTNPMFISGLTVGMAAPDAPAVTEYFDTFHANAVHLWESGLPTRMDGWAAANHPDFRFVSWVRADGTSWDGGLLLGGYGANPAGRIGYQISDEPEDMSDLYDIEAGITAVRAVDPDAFIIVNFSHYSDDIVQQLQYYTSTMDGDIMSFDTYSYDNKTYGRYNQFRVAALGVGMPYWRYIKSYRNKGSTNLPNETDLRWQAMLGLVFGYTGHTWFLYQIASSNPDLDPVLYATAGDFAAAKTPLYDVAAQLNVEMAHLGRAITQLTSTDIRFIPAISILQPSGTQTWSQGAGGDPYITNISSTSSNQDLFVGFFADDAGEQYVMLQNPNHPDASWPSDSSDSVTFQVTFDFQGVTSPPFDTTSVQSLNKETGLIDSLALTPQGGTTAQLEVTLAAGDVVLFKYATGASFALQP
jgi:hypothetical protein